MTKLTQRLSILFIVLGFLLLVGQISRAEQAPVATSPFAAVLNIKGAIGPAVADYFHRGLAQAAQDGATVVVLRLDTPGGLSKSMRIIIKDILASPVPVITYVAPSGARAASAGTYILYASQLAAMAPGTNLGAATPVAIGSPGTADKDKAKDGDKKADSKTAMERKAINDASAYIRSLAQLRGRNEKWAEKAVRQAESLSANEALKMNVINIVAPNIPDLLKQANGKKVKVAGVEKTLATTGLTLHAIHPDWRSRFLSVITDPSVAYILLLIGIYGLFFEFANPGFVLPGVAGAICLLLALYAFHLLPVNYVGLGLMLLGIAFMLVEAFVPSFGALGIGGVIAFVVGSIMLMGTGTPGFTIALPVIFAVTAVTAAFFLLVVNMAIKARLRPVVSGEEELVDAIGEVVKTEMGIQRIRLRGELWQVESDSPLQPGQQVCVVSRSGLILKVKPVQGEQL